MQQKLMVLLVEDDIQACEAIVDCCLSSNDITLTNVTNNSVKAIEMIQSYLPDAIILDLELHHGSGNGFQVLQGLKGLHLDHKPYILVTTNNTSAIMYETARQLGADFIMSKHQDDYSPQSVIDFLTMMKPVIQTHPQVGGPYTPVSPERLHQLRLQRIRTELRLVGISPKAIGYLYLIDAIDLVMQHLNTTQNLCSVIGIKYGKTDSSVERAMQNAINKAWRSSDIDDLLQYYTSKIASDRGVPTVTEFIYHYADKIKSEQEQLPTEE